VTAHLNDLGLTVSGIDLSPGMIAAAQERHQGLRFEVGSMLSLDLADDSLGGRTGSLERARELAGADPAVRAGRLTVEIMAWYCPPGTMSKPGRVVTV
jgi:hypothetical protein